MTRFSDVLLVSDFDHTMTDRASRIPAANLEAVQAFMAEGGAFTIATGRSLPSARSRLAVIPTNAPLLVCNGAACYDLKTETLLFCHPLPDGCVALMQYYEQTYPQLRLEVHCLDKHYLFHRDPSRDAYLRSQNCGFAYVPWDRVPDPKVKFSIYTPREALFSIRADSLHGRFFQALEGDITRRGGGRYTAINSLPGMVEVQAAGTSKGLAARELARKLGRKTLVCIGDAPNDLSMLEEADIACVPADCDPRMLGRGFHEIASCDDGAVADVIRRLRAGEWG